MVPYLRAANVKDGRIVLDSVLEMNFTPQEQEIFSLRPGDVLVTEGSGSLSTVGASAVWHGEIKGTVCFQNTLIRLRPREGVDERFLGWWARSAHGSGLFASIAGGANIYHLSAERLRSLDFALPPLEEQRRIADFLDSETRVLGELASRKRQMRELALLKRKRLIEEVLGLAKASREGRSVPLKYLAREITVGIVVTPSAWYSETGVPVLRGVNVRPGKIVSDNLVRITPEGHALHRKSKLCQGDIVVVRTGQPGVAAVVPEEFDGANCIDLVLIRPGDDLNSKYLEYILNSEYARRWVDEHSVGSIQSHFNVASMKQIPIPELSRAAQDQKVIFLDGLIGQIDRLIDCLSKQEKVLAERRQALITAAVTGQIDVTTARGADLS